MPRIVAPTNQVVTQREKTFLPHVLAVPLGTTVQFRNDDRIYHNVFSIAKPNDFDAANYFIRDGIVVVPKNAVIPAGFWI